MTFTLIINAKDATEKIFKNLLLNLLTGFIQWNFL